VLNWVCLYAAILLEVAGTISLKLSRGLSELTATVVALGCYGASLGLLSLALKHIQVGVAYAIWSGVGTMLVALIGIFHFREPATTLKLVSLCLVGVGVVGLNLSGARQ
jgi:small multidrug resistance pump